MDTDIVDVQCTYTYDDVVNDPCCSTGIFTQVRQQKDPNADAVPQPDNGEQR